MTLNTLVINQLVQWESQWQTYHQQYHIYNWRKILGNRNPFLCCNAPLGRYEYMVINLTLLPGEVIDKYTLLDLVHDDRVYIEIQKGMYELPQSGILANELLQRCLALDGYRQTNHTHGLRKHGSRPVYFLLVVDDFGTKHMGCKNAEYLKASNETHCEISCDWTSSAHCGLTLDWD
jgi:hypothetical protein